MKLGDTIPSTADGKTQAPGEDLSCSSTQTGAQAWPLPGCLGGAWDVGGGEGASWNPLGRGDACASWLCPQGPRRQQQQRGRWRAGSVLSQPAEVPWLPQDGVEIKVTAPKPALHP